MSIAVIAVMILTFAAAVAYPFLSAPASESASDTADARDMLEREKGIALLAIREADLDRAMGKLSEDDYGTLRLQYEQRAVHALAALDELGRTPTVAASGLPASATTAARFCVSCGRAFEADERFCPACGNPRGSLR